MTTHSTPINTNHSGCLLYFDCLPTEIIHEYGQWFQRHLDLGWDGYFITIMYHNIPGSMKSKIQVMHKEIYKLYGKVATRAVRKPRSDRWAHLLPKASFFPDVPAYKKSEYKLKDVSVNDGIHFHGIMVLATKQARLKEPLHLFLTNPTHYVGSKICRIHVEPIISKAALVTDYGGKAIKRTRFPLDNILVLPMTASELPNKRCSHPQDDHARAIKTIQSSMNVSDEVAESIYELQQSHP